MEPSSSEYVLVGEVRKALSNGGPLAIAVEDAVLGHHYYVDLDRAMTTEELRRELLKCRSQRAR